MARPRWTVLYGIAAFGLAALAVTEIAVAAMVRPALESVIGAAAFVAIALWLRTNRGALDQQDWCECAADTMTVRVIPSRRLEPQGATVPRPTAPRIFEPVRVERDDEVLAVGSKL
jgi:hypothetical protein